MPAAVQTDRDAAPAPAGLGWPSLVRRSRGDLLLAGGGMAWVGAVLALDHSGPHWEQQLLGLATWALLVVLLAREVAVVRVQTAVVVVLATAVEYTFAAGLEAYTYRLGNVPAYVPPGHGLVYMTALALGRSSLATRYRRPLVVLTVVVGGTWALYGVTLAARTDALGAFWFLCLLGFLRWGRSTMLYVGAFVVVSWLELLGTALGTWRWAEYDPVLGVVAQGNPPSGAAGGYGWFDLYAVLLAPALLRSWRRATGWLGVSGCRPAGRGSLRAAGRCWPRRSRRRDPARRPGR